MLRDYIIQRKQQKELLLMSHIVIGYPSLTECFQFSIDMFKAGIDIIELQIPSLNTNLDGLVIRQANDLAISNRVDIEQCFTFAKKLTTTIPTPIIFVVYYQTVKEYGFELFFAKVYDSQVAAIIIPDIPEERRFQLHKMASKYKITIVPIIFPKSLQTTYTPLLEYSDFCYCATHNGFTGDTVMFDETLKSYIKKIKENIQQPIAVGFGIRNKNHINFLRGYADIAVIGTKIIEIIESDGIRVASKYLEYLNHSYDNSNISEIKEMF